MVKISKFGEDFLLLPLRINKHIEGYIDFYIGPKKLQNRVKNEDKISPNEILNDCKTLQKRLFIQGYDKKREKYLEKHLLAMRTSIESLCGIEIQFREKFLRLYDVDLQPANESILNNLIENYNKAYKGSGSLEERMINLREKRKVPEERVYPFEIDAWQQVKLEENDRIFIRVESDADANCVLWHDNNPTFEDLKVEIPFIF